LAGSVIGISASGSNVLNYVCTKCNVEKPKELFYAYKENTIKGVSAKCKDCVKKISKEYRKKVGHTKKDAERNKRWRDKNIEHCRIVEAAKRARNPESYKKAMSKWAKNNQAKLRLLRDARRTCIPSWAEIEKINVVYDKSIKYGLEVDHIVPIKNKLVCGLHVWHNLQLLERKLNRSKGNRFWPDMPDQTQLSSAQLQTITA